MEYTDIFSDDCDSLCEAAVELERIMDIRNRLLEDTTPWRKVNELEKAEEDQLLFVPLSTFVDPSIDVHIVEMFMFINGK